MFLLLPVALWSIYHRNFHINCVSLINTGPLNTDTIYAQGVKEAHLT